MKFSPKTIKSISLKLANVKTMLIANNSNQLGKIKDELYEIIHEVDEENHRCYTSHEE
jgi:hypothetical protein|tara:strand:+ start:71 stop:244 length:174 start_codon:yes stop_codon:yes gene_type:complete